MVAFVIGLIVGANLGIVLHCMLIVAKEADKHIEE